MSADMPPIPPAVIEFAEKNGYENVKRNIFWTGKHGEIDTFKDYKEVYDVTEKNSPVYQYILVKDKDIRFATMEELQQLDDVYIN